MFPSYQAIFWCIVLKVAQNLNFVDTNDRFSFHPMGILNSFYKVKLSDKYEKALKDMSRNNEYLILGLEDHHFGKLVQQHNTNFHFGNACCYGGYAQILAMAISDAVA